MKDTTCALLLLLTFPLFLISCLKDGTVKAPTVSAVKMYMTDAEGKDSLISEVFKGETIKIIVSTDADIISIWPSGIRITMKKVNTTVDSIDMFNHPMLVSSDSYIDYGLVGARGLTTTLIEGGWYAYYSYPVAGDFDLTIVATNQGYDGPDLKKTIYDGGEIIVN